MSSTAVNPSVLICPGSFHVPEHYEDLAQRLRAQGFEVVVPALPTMAVSDITPHDTARIDPTPPAGGWPNGFTDADHVKSQLRNLVESGAYVLLVGHSYGGWVATESAVPELRAQTRRSRGQQGGVIGIFFLSGYVLPVGQSVDSFFSPQGDDTPPPPFVKLHGEGKSGLVVPCDAEQYFYGDLSANDARKWSEKLKAQPVIKSPLSQASYVDLPVAYLLCEADKVFPLVVQEMMVKLAEDSKAQITKFSCPAGHSPFLSWTQGTADSIVKFVRAL